MSIMIRLASTTQKVVIEFTSYTYVSKMMGNGRRDIVPETVEVTTYPGLAAGKYVVIHGPQIKKDGTRGRYRTVGWSIGGRYDQSDEAPAIVHEILKALQ